jgi:DNA-binding NarL/FixJ family response regulator
VIDGLDYRALIVEDDHSWQEILTEILNDAGLQVDVVSSLEEALNAIRLKAHRIAIVDLSLGGRDHHNQDGLQVLNALRGQDPGCAAILLTGFATVELAVIALTEHKAFTCLRKEAFRRDQFRLLINRVMASAPANGFGNESSGIDPITPAKGIPQSIPVLPEETTLESTFSKSAQKRQGRLALVVEDDAGWRNILSEVLSDAGLDVHLSSGFGEAFGRLRREKYDLAVIDLSLNNSLPITSYWTDSPVADNLDGFRLLASTRAGGIPTLVVSGVASPGDIERAYNEYGIFAYLQKQVFNRQAFLQAVQEALAAPKGAEELESLTEREREVLELLARGMTNKEIAEDLVISTNTVKRHLKAIFEKLEIHTRSGAVAKAVGSGVISEKTGGE